MKIGKVFEVLFLSKTSNYYKNNNYFHGQNFHYEKQ